VTVADLNAFTAMTTGVITAPVAATGGADTFVFHNNILTVGSSTAFAQAADALSFVGMAGQAGTLAKIAKTNAADDISFTVDGTNTTVYVIDTDATDLNGAGTTASNIADFTSMVNVAAFLATGVTTNNTASQVEYFVINDGSVTTASYVYKFVDGGTNTTVENTELTLIGTITTDAALTATNITIA